MKRNLKGTPGERFREKTFLTWKLGTWVGIYDYCNTNLQYFVLFKSGTKTYLLVKMLFQRHKNIFIGKDVISEVTQQLCSAFWAVCDPSPFPCLPPPRPSHHSPSWVLFRRPTQTKGSTYERAENSDQALSHTYTDTLFHIHHLLIASRTRRPCLHGVAVVHWPKFKELTVDIREETVHTHQQAALPAWTRHPTAFRRLSRERSWVVRRDRRGWRVRRKRRQKDDESESTGTDIKLDERSQTQKRTLCMIPVCMPGSGKEKVGLWWWKLACGYLWLGYFLGGKHNRLFRSDENVLYLDPGSSYTRCTLM